MKTYSPKPEHIERRWYVIDASDVVLGRLASEAAAILRGKHKPIFAPHMDTGDNVIIVNAGKVALTGGKELKKMAYRHSGYPGGITGTRYDRLMAERPKFVVEKAIRGMLPKNRIGRAMFKKLHVVEGPEHPHSAQQPVAYELGKPPLWEGIPEPKARVIREPKKKPAAKPETKTTAATKPAAKPASKPAAKRTAAAKPKATTKKTTAKKPTSAKTTKTVTADTPSTTGKTPRRRAKKTEGEDA
jgi:large subunit ribosomal protein L13